MPDHSLDTRPLSGVRIWLSGSFPGETPARAEDPDFVRFRGFLRRLAQAVFRLGGAIIHGSHPSVRDSLLEAAEEYQQATGHKAPLTLVVSDVYWKNPEASEIDPKQWKQNGDVIPTPEVSTAGLPNWSNSVPEFTCRSSSGLSPGSRTRSFSAATNMSFRVIPESDGQSRCRCGPRSTT